MYYLGMLYMKKTMKKGMIYTTQDNSYILGGMRGLSKKAKL